MQMDLLTTEEVINAKPTMWGLNIVGFLSSMPLIFTLLYSAIAVFAITIFVLHTKIIIKYIRLKKKIAKAQAILNTGDNPQDEIYRDKLILVNGYKERLGGKIYEHKFSYFQVVIFILLLTIAIPNIKQYDRWVDNYVNPYIQQQEYHNSHNVQSIYPNHKYKHLIDVTYHVNGISYTESMPFKYDAKEAKPVIQYKQLDETISNVYRAGHIFDTVLILPVEYLID